MNNIHSERSASSSQLIQAERMVKRSRLELPTARTVTLRVAVSEESASGGQGYIRCNCAGSNKCQSNR